MARREREDSIFLRASMSLATTVPGLTILMLISNLAADAVSDFFPELGEAF
jgi:hypothetical protein